MKKLLIVLSILALVVAPAMAFDEDQNQTGLKADAPYLIELADNHFLGSEVSKDFRGDVEGDEGWSVYGKYTYTGTLFNANLDRN